MGKVSEQPSAVRDRASERRLQRARREPIDACEQHGRGTLQGQQPEGSGSVVRHSGEVGRSLANAVERSLTPRHYGEAVSVLSEN